jgi:hypothetical protein
MGVLTIGRGADLEDEPGINRSVRRRAKRPTGRSTKLLDLYANIRSMGADDDDRIILAALVAAHPAMVGIGALRDLDGVQYPDEAVRRLRDDGLVVRVGDLVGTSRTFRRAQVLLSL